MAPRIVDGIGESDEHVSAVVSDAGVLVLDLRVREPRVRGANSAGTIAEHRRLTRLSPQSRHIVAASSGHWIQFDEPDLVISAIRDLVYRARGSSAA